MKNYGYNSNNGISYALNCKDGRIRAYSRSDKRWFISAHTTKSLRPYIAEYHNPPDGIPPYPGYKTTIRAQMARRF